MIDPIDPNQIPLFGDDGQPFKQKSPWGTSRRRGFEIPKTKSGGLDKRTSAFKMWRSEENARAKAKRDAIKAEETAKKRAETIKQNRQGGAKKGWETRRTNITKNAKYWKGMKIKGGLAFAAAGAAAFMGATSDTFDNTAGGFFKPGLKKDDVKNAGFWGRQGSIMAAGHLDPNRTALSGLWDYNTARIGDGLNVAFNSPLSQSGLSPGMQVGAMAGGTMSLAAATAVGAFKKAKGKGKFGMIGALGAGLAGALFGGYQGTKVDIAFSRAVQTARKNVLGQSRRMSNRAHTRGRGYRSWASPRGKRRMGQPGHLGMDGSMAFAMHNARHRSTL